VSQSSELAAIIICVACQRVFVVVVVVVVYFVIDSVRKLLDILSYVKLRTSLYNVSKTSNRVKDLCMIHA
jgi:hypothetical protein